MSAPQENTWVCPQCNRTNTGPVQCPCVETELRLPSISQVLGSSYDLPIRHNDHAYVAPGPSFANPAATPPPARRRSPPRQQRQADYNWSSPVAWQPRHEQPRRDSSPVPQPPHWRDRSASPAHERHEDRRSPLTRRSRPALAPLAQAPVPPQPQFVQAQAAGAPAPVLPRAPEPEPESWAPRLSRASTARGTRVPPPTLHAEQQPAVAPVARGSRPTLAEEIERQESRHRSQVFLQKYARKVIEGHQPKLGRRYKSTRSACNNCVEKQRKCTWDGPQKDSCDQCQKDDGECTWPVDATPKSRRPGPGDGGRRRGDDDDDDDDHQPGPARRLRVADVVTNTGDRGEADQGRGGARGRPSQRGTAVA